MIRTQDDRRIEALEREFPRFQIWIDFLPRDDGRDHWHARQPFWDSRQIIHARDNSDMRDKLIVWTRQNAEAK